MIERSPSVRLIEELSKGGDPYSLQFQIEQAGYLADCIERSRAILNGDRTSWTEVNIGAKTVEVVVTNVQIRYERQVEQLRKLITSIRSQRALIPSDDGDPDPTDV